MRRWGIIITAFYALLPCVAIPGLMVLLDPRDFDFGGYRHWQFWLVMALPVAGQVLLLFLSVDTAWRRRSPRRHIRVSLATAAFFFALLFVAAVLSLAAGLAGDHGIDRAGRMMVLGIDLTSPGWLAAVVLQYWILWTIVLSLYMRAVSERLTRVMSWLIKGSVLELLIAVPSHIAARQRNDCCAEPRPPWESQLASR
jgi:hypothetical protein